MTVDPLVAFAVAAEARGAFGMARNVRNGEFSSLSFFGLGPLTPRTLTGGASASTLLLLTTSFRAVAEVGCLNPRASTAAVTFAVAVMFVVVVAVTLRSGLGFTPSAVPRLVLRGDACFSA